MADPIIARTNPYLVTLNAGRTYYWCSCGRSKKQPYCDGSHQGTGFMPSKYQCSLDGEEVLFCACKRTSTPPFCDGAHTNLPGGSPLDDPHSPENQRIKFAQARGGRISLDGRCYIISPDQSDWRVEGSLRYCQLISPQQGAQYQALYLLRITEDVTPLIGIGQSHAILYIRSGSASATVSGKTFRVEETVSLYVRPGEVFQLDPDVGKLLEVFLFASPLMEIE